MADSILLSWWATVRLRTIVIAEAEKMKECLCNL